MDDFEGNLNAAREEGVGVFFLLGSALWLLGIGGGSARGKTRGRSCDDGGVVLGAECFVLWIL